MNTTVIDNCSTHLTDNGKTNSGNCFHKRAFRYFIAVIPVALVLLISTSYQESPGKANFPEYGYLNPETIDSLRAFLNSDAADSMIRIEGEIPQMISVVRTLYLNNGYKPVWTHHRGLNERAEELLSLVENSREYGLEPASYHLAAIRQLQLRLEDISLPARQSTTGIALEVLISDAAFRLMVNLHAGYRAYDSTLFSEAWVAELPGILASGLMSKTLSNSILSVQPQFIEYLRLQAASRKFVRNNTLTDEWVNITYPTRDSAELFGQIRMALQNYGYINSTDFDDNLIAALKRFQYYHGLKPDGRPGKNTIEALEQSMLYKYRILALNLDRLRKKQHMDANMLYVNIPAYQMKVFQGNKLVDTFRVIVGHPSTPTPVLSSHMNKVIANPTWFVPKSITMNEIIPKIKSDSNYLKRNNFKLLDKDFKTVSYETIDINGISADNFNYTIRQDRGADNSLGQLKFIFPSPYAIYLHDTPGKSMFSKDLRAFSHGCVRVQHPERLAGYILQKINADTTDIVNLIRTGKHREFGVNSELSVEILYITCEADDAGRLFFYKDIYGTDKKELEKFSTVAGI
ncbi:MAG: L,D-transpeptidase family protein [Bacteroidales bacterium]|nr:L,D-transpeptidase family protein [Bacteroidales bacterium]